MDEQSGAAAERSPEATSDSRYIEAKALPAPSGAIAHEAEPERPGGIFGRLVNGDEDIVGLVAYALYKQNKIDWMQAFENARGRKPESQEFAAYIVGENTPRRVATYRFLAESTITRSSGSGRGAHPMVSGTLSIVYALGGVACVAAVIVLLRFFISLKH
jgi:hypothetical protein